MEISEHKKQQDRERIAMRNAIKDLTGEKDPTKWFLLTVGILSITVFYYSMSAAYWMRKAKSKNQ